MPCFGQAYLVRSSAPGTIRGFHRHQRLWDYFSIIQGRAKFVLVRTKDGEPSAVDEEWIVTLGEEAPALLVVPATVWHGWMSLTTDVILLSVASEVYCHSSPDEERIPWTTFGEDVWKIQNR
jgi:dTDP-4-dehydrorhamnose 3,5-epimerase-like enzyme